MAKILGPIRTHDGGRCRNPNCSCRRRTRDGQYPTEVARYDRQTYLIEAEGADLVVYQITDLMDGGNVTNGVTAGAPTEAVRAQERQAAADAAKYRSARRAYDSQTGLIARMNEKARKLWPTSPNGGGR